MNAAARLSVVADSKPSASEQVRLHVEREISEGLLLPGDALAEDALAARFRVSRTPVREAMLQLSARGLVTIAPRSGIHVSRLSVPELLVLLEYLGELEGACAKLATRRLSAEQARELRRIHAASKASVDAGDAAGYAHANAQFHELLYLACSNSALTSAIAHARCRTQIYRQSAFQSEARRRRSREEHGSILKAVLAGDAAAAGQLMVDHFSIGNRDFADFLATMPPQLLAAQVDYPGKRAAEFTRRKTNAAAARRKPVR
ncbi:MAG: bacterial regulatory s, gntR family protein [Ramlibacter sp.]|nr:bacterial regulatory s, gntR family protein [Ramlibacter sp.]